MGVFSNSYMVQKQAWTCVKRMQPLLAGAKAPSPRQHEPPVQGTAPPAPPAPPVPPPARLQAAAFVDLATQYETIIAQMVNTLQLPFEVQKHAFLLARTVAADGALAGSKPRSIACTVLHLTCQARHPAASAATIAQAAGISAATIKRTATAMLPIAAVAMHFC